MAINKVEYGNTTLIDLTPTTATAADVASGKIFFGRDGVQTVGTATGGGGGAISVVDTLDANGGTIRTITAVDLSPTTAEAADVASGKVFFTRDGTQTTGTASGGGGGSYPWFGSGAEKLSTGLIRTINLKNDTDYDNWTASTTATTLIAASETADLSISCDLWSYDYYFAYKGFVQPTYLSGATLKYAPYRTCQYGVFYISSYPNANTYADLSAGHTSYITTGGSSNTNLWVLYYYNNAGNLASRSATQCGPIYMSMYPTVNWSTSALTNGVGTIEVKLPAFYAKCDSNRFSTDRKSEIDSANTNYYLTIEVYRVPRGNAWYSKYCNDMFDALNA